MSAYYRGRRARLYEQHWSHFAQRTQQEVLALIDIAALRRRTCEQRRAPRLLDVACGTGRLLSYLYQQFPDAELYGIDGSQDMLLQARQRLPAVPSLRLEHVNIGSGEQARLPFPSGSFDLITCTNALHDLADPATFLADLMRLLVPGGWLAIEDYARRPSSLAWRLVEWLALRIDGSQGQPLTLAEAEQLCNQAGIYIVRSRAFVIDRIFHGWAIAGIKE